MAETSAPNQNSITTRDTLISTISTREVLLGAYGIVGRSRCAGEDLDETIPATATRPPIADRSYWVEAARPVNVMTAIPMSFLFT